MSNNIVISFSHEDMEYVTAFADRLDLKLRRYCVIGVADTSSSVNNTPRSWIYPKQLDGTQFNSQIRQQIGNALAVTFVLSEKSGHSAYVKDEASYALSPGMLITVIALGDIEVLRQTPVGQLLRDRTWIDPRVKDEVASIIQTLESLNKIRRAKIGNGYRYKRQLVERPYGGTFEAFREQDNALVVVKEVISDDLEVLRELDAKFFQLNPLRHVALPKVEDYVQEEGRRYLVMEHVSGKHLGDLLARRNQPFAWDEVRPWVEEVLNTLVFLHQQRVWHLGIKPQNLILTRERQIKLLDIGLDRRPQSASMIGTPDPYLAPEQFNDLIADARTDIYALGATLYTLLTGDAQPSHIKPPVHKRNHAVPEYVSRAIQQSMEPEPAKRFKNANAMLAAIDHEIDEGGKQEPVQLADEQPNKQTAGPKNRSGTSRWLLAGAALGMALLVAVALFFLSQPRTPQALLIGSSITPSVTTPVTSAQAPPTSAPTMPSVAATPMNIPVPAAIYGPTAQDAINRIKQDDEIIVGVRFDTPPFGNDAKLRDILHSNSGQLAELCNPSKDKPDFNPLGYDIDVVHEFAKRWLGDEHKVKLRCVPGPDRVKVVHQGEGGVRIGVFSFSKLPDRCNPMGVACSVRYMLDGQGVLVRRDSGITQLCDVGGKSVAIVRGTSATRLFVDGATLFCGFQTQPITQVVDTRDVAITQLLSGTVSAYATNVEILKALASEHPNDLVVVPGEFGDEEFGIAVTPSETGLLELINLTIEAMKKDGTLDALMRAGFHCAVPPIDVDFDPGRNFPPYVSGTAPQNPPCQHPSPTSVVGDTIYNVTRGETLSGIARLVYDGDSKLWPCIAQANGISNPKTLQPGPLKIPKKETCSSPPSTPGP